MSEYVNKAWEDGADRSNSHSPVQDHGEALSQTWLRLCRASGLGLVGVHYGPVLATHSLGTGSVLPRGP